MCMQSAAFHQLNFRATGYYAAGVSAYSSVKTVVLPTSRWTVKLKSSV